MYLHYHIYEFTSVLKTRQAVRLAELSQAVRQLVVSWND